jgi:tetratricopeptide (TPR) repeat protein
LKPTPQRTVEDTVEALRPKPGTTRKCTVLLGAGCSISAGIPSAGAVVQHIRTTYPAAYARATPKDYPGCMAALDRGVRRDLIGRYIDSAKINWAHLALAQLIEHGYVDRVLTTNFDPLVSRACSLINSFPAVYDFAASHLFNPEQVSEKSIFHLHGQRDGFVLLNTREEVNKHRRFVKPVFEDAHKGRIWIVVGYSGENDPVFDLLADVRTFEYGLYWVGYEKTPPAHVTKRLLTPGRGTHFLGDWDADDFFVTLAQKLGCFPPRFVTQPFSHLKSMFSMLKDYRAPRNNLEDEPGLRESRFDVASVIRPQLDKLIAGHEQALSAEYYFLAGEHERVVALFKGRQLKKLTDREKDTYGWSHMILGDRAHSAAKIENDRDLYRKAAEHFAIAAKIPATEADALYNWGNVLFDLSIAARDGALEVMTRSAEALLKRAVVKYGVALAKDPQFADAHNNLANALTDLARSEYPARDNGMLREAFGHYEAALRHTQTPDIVHCNFAKALHDLARTTNDLALFKKSMTHFNAAGALNPSYYSVYLSWGHALADLARRTGSAKTYKAAFEKYRRAAEIEPTDTAAHHSWYYTLLEFAKQLKGRTKAACLKEAAAVSTEQKRRRRNLERRILRSERAR